MNAAPDIQLDPAQATAMARGLYAIAQSDGLHEKEAALVAGFWEEAGGSEKALEDLKKGQPITSSELAHAMPSVDMRRMFIKTALLLAFADGQVSGKESELVREYTHKLGLSNELSDLEGQVKDFLLSQLAHIHNTDALTEIAKKLAI